MEIGCQTGGASLSLPDYRILGPGHYSILVDGRSYEVFVRKEKNRYLVEVNGHLIPVEQKISLGSSDETAGPQSICSPMPGRVIGIKFQEGESVEAGEGVVIVEAMKMENELVTPKSGKIEKILVKVGTTVEAGQELVRIE